MDRGLRSDINKATVSTMNPVWKSRVDALTRNRMDARVLSAGTRIAGGNPPRALAGTSARKLSGGGRPAELAGAVEFGTKNRNAWSQPYSTHSRTGTRYTVKRRRTKRQLPSRRPAGHVVWPAFLEVAPRMVSLWVQLVVRKVNDAAGAGE